MRPTDGSARRAAGPARRSQLLALVLPCLLAAPAPSAPAVASGVAPAVHAPSASEVGTQALSADPAAALRRAAALTRDGDVDAAIALYADIARRHPIVADHAQALRAQALLARGDLGEAVAALLRALEAAPADSPLRVELFLALGDARERFNDARGARAAWESALRAASAPDVEAPIALRLARSFDREGDVAAAHARYVQIWFSYPLSEASRVASERLDELEAAKAVAPRSGDDWRRRADDLFRAHRNAAALGAYDRALALGLSRGATRRARMQRAHTLFRMRRYPEAAAAFAALPHSADVRLWHARSLARSNDVLRAIDELEAIAAEGNREIGLRATYLAGLLLDGRDFHERARANFEKVAASRRYPGLARGALWRLAWRDYRDGDCDSALPRLERLRADEADPIEALRWRYWRARCMEKLGLAGASEEFAAMAADFPFTYYGWRASFRSRGGRPPAGTDGPARGSLTLGASGIADDAARRVHILVAAGLAERASLEVRGLQRRVETLADRLELAELLSESGDAHAAQRVVLMPYLLELARGPRAGLEELWWLAWPRAFADRVDAAVARPGAAERELVYAIMREESGYRPRVLSPAGAYGLMQIMPGTGERLARRIGRQGFESDDLLDPAINVELGAFYLGELSARFPRRPSAAIASYNAGPRAVAEWLDSPPLEDDEWVEAIPYDQTRRYVKRVLRSLHVYRVLY